MPYKDPERKRQWEHEYREQRNARRQELRLMGPTVFNLKYASDPPPSQSTSGWKDILGLAVGVGIILLGAIAGTPLLIGVNATDGSGTAST